MHLRTVLVLLLRRERSVAPRPYKGFVDKAARLNNSLVGRRNNKCKGGAVRHFIQITKASRPYMNEGHDGLLSREGEMYRFTAQRADGMQVCG